MIDWPLDVNEIRRNSESNTFGMVRRRADGTPKPHQGHDYHALIGTPCYAIADGTIVGIRDQGDYGKQIVLRFDHNGTARYAAYCHLSEIHVSLNQRVNCGTVIGKTGESGNAKGMAPIDQHLHFEIRSVPWPGLGLEGRESPALVLGKCPLHDPIRRAGA